MSTKHTPAEAFFKNGGMPNGAERTAYMRAYTDGVNLDDKWTEFRAETADPEWQRRCRISYAISVALQVFALIGSLTMGALTVPIFVGATLLAGVTLRLSGVFLDRGVFNARERTECQSVHTFTFFVANLFFVLLIWAIIVIVRNFDNFTITF